MFRGLHPVQSPQSSCRPCAPAVSMLMSMQVPWSDLAPSFASQGDVDLELDCGSQLTAHRAFLVYASRVLADLISLTSKPAEGCKLRVRVPCVSQEQAVLLLQVTPASADQCSICVIYTMEQAVNAP